MARVVDDSVFARRHMGRHAMYPWDEWLDGQARELIMGEDFPTDAATFVHAAYPAAKSRGMKVRTHTAGRTVTIQAYREESP